MNTELEKNRLIIGIITYGKTTARYLPYFLPSLENQTFKNFKIIVVDNTENVVSSPVTHDQDEYMDPDGQVARINENIEYIEENYFSDETRGKLDIEIEVNNKNIGFACAYNQIIKKAVGEEANYLLVINPDIILDSDAIEKMVNVLESDEELGSVSPKVLKWDFERNKKTKIIDTCGIKLMSGLRFFDTGQNEEDNGQYDKVKIIGPSGAAGMYKLEALEKIKKDGEYFDEQMFMYKEDCDMAYRLALSKFKSKCVSEAKVYHDRTASSWGEGDFKVAMNRKNKSRQVKKWSFLNQLIINTKYWRLQNLKSKLAVLIHELKMFVFAILFEQYLIGQIVEYLKIRNNIKRY